MEQQAHNPERKPTRVFVSYSSADRPLARRVARRLRHAGASVFLDEDRIEAGQVLLEAIEPEIRQATHVVVIWTDPARASQWVQKELQSATETAPSKPSLIPLLFTAPSGNAIVLNALEAGVYSSEFEHWPHALIVGPLARLLVQDLMQEDETSESVKSHVRTKLKEAGLPDYLP